MLGTYHPSGSSKPLKADIHMTNKIVETCNPVNIII
ncbi:JAB domain-containing protein [Rickettsia oklahomensis]|uniref:JAB domain-containing protein n=1 Tax=Rickettsia oklahomensis TaxID=3141789 RepID=A0AAU7BZD3_9RICK